MDAEITPLWETPVWIGEISAAALQQMTTLTTTDAASITPADLPAITDLEQALDEAFHLAPERRWHHRLDTWNPGFYRGMTYSPATVRALVIVTSNQPDQHQDSGAIRIHDPRVGAANVALPGLPWGRSTKIPPIAGGAFAVPGWLACSIAPLRDDHIMRVWTAEAIAVGR